MLGVSSGTAEEFYSRCLLNAQVLEHAARQRALAGDLVGALADASGADVSMLQAVMWERILVASRTPQRQFFQAAEAIVRGLRAAGSEGEAPTTLGRMVAASRDSMATAFDDSLADEMAARWPDISYLEALPAVTAAELAEAAGERLESMSPGSFVQRRRTQSSALLLDAQAHRVRGQISDAIQRAYEGDFKALEAYLVESAVEVGDTALLTVTARWDLAVHAVTELPGLPSDFLGAVAAIRSTLSGAVGEADGRRFLESVVPV